MMFCLGLLLIVQTYAWTRDDCVRVAQAWEAGNVPYSQSTRYNTKQYVSSGKGPYRSDCSGFVSAAWDLAPPGDTTRTIPHQSISQSALIRCDALLDPAHHVALFWGWADASQTRPIVVEEYTTGKFTEQRTWSSLRGFQPIRRNGWDGSGGSGGGGSPIPPPTPKAPSGGGGSGCKVTASALNVRSCASTSCSVLTSVQNGGAVTPTGETSGVWIKISSPTAGWVSGQYVSCSGGSRQEQTSSSHSPNVGLIVGVSIAGVCALVAVGALVAYFIVRSREPVVETP